MIDRNQVALEKMDKALNLMKEREIDLWIFYSREKRDPSFELMFNCSLAEESLFALFADGRRLALTDARNIPKLENSGMYTQCIASAPEEIVERFKEVCDLSAVGKIALNMSVDDDRCDGLTVGLYNKLCRGLGRKFVKEHSVSGYEMLEYLRAVKSPSEIAIMRECSKITTDVYDVVFQKVCVGMSETDVGDIMMEELAKRGCGTGIGDPSEYPMILLVKCGMSHRKPSPDNYIEAGDMLVIDFSARYNGYTSDIARTMYFLKEGETEAPKEVRRCADAAIRAVGAVMAEIKPGMRGYEVDAIGRKSILDSGYPNIRHSVGHLVGLEVHDGGTVLGPNKNKKSCQGILRENEIYALEPTVLQDGGLPCAIIEDNVLLTKDGCELISKRQTKLIEIPYRVREGIRS